MLRFRDLLCLAFLLPALVGGAFAAPRHHAPGLLPHRQRHPGDFSFDRVVIEPLPWPGDMAKTIDDTNLGNYFFEVRDQASGRLLYSRGFGSMFSEWADDRRSQEAESHLFRVAAVSCPGRAGEDRAEGAPRR